MTCWRAKWTCENEVSGGVSIDCQPEFSWDIRCPDRHQWLLQKNWLLCWHVADGCLGYSQQFTGFSSINPRQAGRQAGLESSHILLVLHCSHGTGVKCQNWCFHKKQEDQGGRGMLRNRLMVLCISGTLYTFHLMKSFKWPWEMDNIYWAHIIFQAYRWIL